MINDTTKETAFLVTNASGRHINLLNDNNDIQPQPMMIATTVTHSPPSSVASDENINTDSSSSSSIHTPLPSPGRQTQFDPKRKYHCTEPGCTKSFTTSGHLARHFRIHTGEKNFPCLFPGCLSRFSRQDNMMQHYRTHMSPKSRKSQKRVITEELHPRPKLHAHQRIRSDPYMNERPLTIDQHLNNYRQSLLTKSSTTNLVHYPNIPLNSIVELQQNHLNRLKDTINQNKLIHITPTKPTTQYPIYNNTSSFVLPSSPITTTNTTTTTTTTVLEQRQQPEITFYQHEPLNMKTIKKSKVSLPFTLLHPTSLPSRDNVILFKTIQKQQKQQQQQKEATLLPSSLATTIDKEDDDKHTISSSQAGLLQLAHIVSTFG
ncbi:uncharacterized protein BX663DRAFT_553329 [Cokeromyces recurvatus]|uniref:uncharacterized protein n=1 Tax=Cokeromyces recurvatus TaxID=90255 RepID=UPI0022208013|nr:uncharacterized protein BX663DRAFT_553329 [Cokeromyces recurvatus]KAI7901083.1 hypothetical protein BX663DRAFT_553329 [Cokeromyces recurvatus]